MLDNQQQQFSQCAVLYFLNFSSPVVGCKVGFLAGTFAACPKTLCWVCVWLWFPAVLADAAGGLVVLPVALLGPSVFARQLLALLRTPRMLRSWHVWESSAFFVWPRRSCRWVFVWVSLPQLWLAVPVIKGWDISSWSSKTRPCMMKRIFKCVYYGHLE